MRKRKEKMIESDTSYHSISVYICSIMVVIFIHKIIKSKTGFVCRCTSAHILEDKTKQL